MSKYEKGSSKIEGMDKFVSDLEKLSATARKETMLSGIEEGAQVIKSYAQDNARNQFTKHPTGHLVNSIDVRRNGKVIEVGSFGVIYNKIQEFGGVIKARTAKALHFQVDGQWFMKKSVVIPARPYLRPAVDNHMPEIKDAISDALRGLLQKAVGK
jgi:HK97 gp10 family phage protein